MSKCRWRRSTDFRQLIDLYPKTLDTAALGNLTLRRMFCNFLSISLLIVQARSVDDVDAQVDHCTEAYPPFYLPPSFPPICWFVLTEFAQLQYYGATRKHAREFRLHLHGQLNRLQGDALADLSKKHAALVAFDFEAAAHLREWDELDQMVEVTLGQH